ncbi:MAG: hypothetical protein EXR55_04675 [Dehalococcoidia bacterium]|nr:hypothetical protein [Dehalococcoidia bacterium]
MGPDLYANPAVPMDWAAGRLVERHRLPWHVAAPLTFYVLSRDPDWITRLKPLSVAVNYEDDPSSDPGAFTVSV